MNKDTFYMIERLKQAGISESDAWALRRISMSLHRWHELECGDGNGCVERDETTGKTYWHNSNTGKRYRCPDRETGALKRLKAIAAKYPEFVPYVQGDPRGAALYMVHKKYIHNSGFDGSTPIESCYSQGIAIYK